MKSAIIHIIAATQLTAADAPHSFALSIPGPRPARCHNTATPAKIVSSQSLNTTGSFWFYRPKILVRTARLRQRRKAVRISCPRLWPHCQHHNCQHVEPSLQATWRGRHDDCILAGRRCCDHPATPDREVTVRSRFKHHAAVSH